jgi:hypothetical protein
MNLVAQFVPLKSDLDVQQTGLWELQTLENVGTPVGQILKYDN